LVRRLLIGVLVVFGVAVTVFNPLISGILAVGVWIYLVRMIRKQENSVLNDQMEEEIITSHSKREKALLIVAGFSFLVFILGTVAHNVLHGQSELEETTFFFIALVAVYVFIATTAGAIFIFIRARQKRSQFGHNTV
jgi:hypothetical protein